MPVDLLLLVPSGMEALAARELRDLGGLNIRPGKGTIAFRGELATAARVCLWSRVGSRLLLPLAKCPAANAEQLHQSCRDLPWEEHFRPGISFAVDFSGSNEALRHTLFGAQKVKDAILDRFMGRGLARPPVRPQGADLMVHVRLQGETARLSLDLSGESLHRRGYRVAPTSAPLKENLAAAILLLADWPRLAQEGHCFLDPLCGSGTLAIEAAWMAGDVAPNLGRATFGFHAWKGWEEGVLAPLRQEAEERARAGLARLPPLFAWDGDGAVLEHARKNVAAAGLTGKIHLEARPLSALTPPGERGLLATNPPYGQRQGEADRLIALYQGLGERLRSGFGGWRAALFSERPQLEAALGLRVTEEHALFNGPLACRLWIHDLPRALPVPAPGDESAIANRLKKNLKHLARWRKREGVDCFRLYDADMPEYSAAVDVYGEWAHVQEYQPPREIDPASAVRRFHELLAAVGQVLGQPQERIVAKVRRQAREGQYERLAEEGTFLTVAEDGVSYLVNLRDYLDTGLFLDLRLVRRRLRELARGRRFLNLFGYTGTATVAAAAGGASETVTVDLSHTYLAWAGRNLTLNGLAGPQHRLEAADCLTWLPQERGRYELILLAPPVFSNSKRMREVLDLNRDHGHLIEMAARLLTPGGILFFVTHARGFRLAEETLPAGLTIKESTGWTVPPDFAARHPRFHRSWEMVARG